MAKIKTKTKKDSKNSLKSLKEKIKSLENDLLKESEEVKRVSEKNIRLLAEFDNYKRRTQKERSDLLKYEGQSLAKSLLPILDDLNRTLEIDEKTESNAIMKGINLIVTKLDKILVDLGIEAFDSIGEKFNPDRHEALMSEKSKEKENVIIKEFEKGYVYNDKILRHAKVVVSKK
ncbi:MAG: nucleotide exchange factor GrpE [Candidatus Neomarinimicrobiota bacterium]|nr:nucleotide exchange factor GrpE [Candidatus Neomarinimicrobiota bacterium]